MKTSVLYLILFFGYLLSVQQRSYGQMDQASMQFGSDSVRNFFPNHYGSTDFRYMLSLDIKRGIQSNWSVNSYGIRVGVELNGVHSLNIGYFSLVSGRSVVPSLDLFHPSDLQETGTSYKGGFLALYYERAVYQHNRLLITIPSYLKVGRINKYEINGSNQRILDNRLPLFSIASGLQVQYYFLDWFGPKLIFGYRQVINNAIEIQNLYNGFYAGLSGRIILSELPFEFIKS